MTTEPDIILVIVAPSGCGKGTTIGYLQKLIPWLFCLVSYTDREPGPNEKHGVHYFFVSAGEFDHLRATREFLSFGQYNGNRYGDPMPEGDHRCILMEVIIETALDVRAHHPENTIIVWLQPPGRTEALRIAFLKKRLTNRGRDSRASISKRLLRASVEMQIGPGAADVTYVNRWSRVTAWRICWLIQRRLLRQRLRQSLMPARMRIWS